MAKTEQCPFCDIASGHTESRTAAVLYQVRFPSQDSASGSDALVSTIPLNNHVNRLVELEDEVKMILYDVSSTVPAVLLLFTYSLPRAHLPRFALRLTS